MYTPVCLTIHLPTICLPMYSCVSPCPYISLCIYLSLTTTLTLLESFKSNLKSYLLSNARAYGTHSDSYFLSIFPSASRNKSFRQMVQYKNLWYYYLSVYVSLCLFVCLFTKLPICLSICPSAPLDIFCLSECLWTFYLQSISPSLHLSCSSIQDNRCKSFLRRCCCHETKVLCWYLTFCLFVFCLSVCVSVLFYLSIYVQSFHATIYLTFSSKMIGLGVSLDGVVTMEPRSSVDRSLLFRCILAGEFLLGLPCPLLLCLSDDLLDILWLLRGDGIEQREKSWIKLLVFF